MATPPVLLAGLAQPGSRQQAAERNEDCVDLSTELACASGMYDLWQGGALCDCELVAADGLRLPAHKVVLASSSKYFKALLTGAGQEMREGQELRQQGR